MERRIAAILAADMVGFSRLIEGFREADIQTALGGGSITRDAFALRTLAAAPVDIAIFCTGI